MISRSASYLCRSLNLAWQLQVHILVLFMVTFLGDQGRAHGNLCFHLTDKETGLSEVGKRHPLCLTAVMGRFLTSLHFPMQPYGAKGSRSVT